MDNISKSLFSLCKDNNGLFKSEKQANFITDVTGKSWLCVKSYNLGSDYNFKKCGSAEFLFKLDQAGVVEVIKTTGSGKQSVYFARMEQSKFEDLQTQRQEKEEQWAVIDAKRARLYSRLEQLLKLSDFSYILKNKDLTIYSKDELKILVEKAYSIKYKAEKRQKKISDKLELLISSY